MLTEGCYPPGDAAIREPVRELWDLRDLRAGACAVGPSQC